MAPEIVIPIDKNRATAIEAMRRNLIPLRILCPDCRKIFTLYIKDFEQGLHCLLGQACPFCRRFLKETDDPEKLLVDLSEIKKAIQTK